jgi:hypothetical protein
LQTIPDYTRGAKGAAKGAIETYLPAAVPLRETMQFLDDRLYEYNASMTGVDDGTIFSITIHDPENRIIAGSPRRNAATVCQAPSRTLSTG